MLKPPSNRCSFPRKRSPRSVYVSCCTGTMERTRDDGREEGPVSASSSIYSTMTSASYIDLSVVVVNIDNTGSINHYHRKKTRRSASRNHHRRRCNNVELQQEEAVQKLFPTLELELLTVWFRCCCRSPGLQSVMIRAVLYTSIGGRRTSFSCPIQSSAAQTCYLVG